MTDVAATQVEGGTFGACGGWRAISGILLRNVRKMPCLVACEDGGTGGLRDVWLAECMFCETD